VDKLSLNKNNRVTWYKKEKSGEYPITIHTLHMYFNDKYNKKKV